MKRALLSVALMLGACGEPADRPETIGVCDEGGCESGSATGAQGYDSSGSSSTTGGSSTDQGVTLRGGVRVYSDDSFLESASESYTDNAVVLAPGAEQAVVSDLYSAGDYSVEGVEKRTLAWVLVEPEDGSLLSPLPMLQHVDTVATSAYDLFMVNLDVLEEVFAGVTTQPTIAEDHAQVVMRLMDEYEEPVPGVSIQTTEGDFIAYYGGTSWSDQNAATDDSGLVMIGNVVAPEYPGRGIQVVVEGAEDENFAIDVAEGAVTWARLRIQ